MMYLNPKKNSSGAHPNLQSTPAPGLLEFPAAFQSEFYKAGKHYAGFVDIEHDGQTVTSCVWNEEAYQAYLAEHPVNQLTPAERRETSYNTEAIIPWAGELLTVTAAAQLWQYYAAEGSGKAEELQALIAQAKAEIRAKYPDEEVTV